MYQMKKYVFFNYLLGLSFALIEISWQLYVGVIDENAVWFQSTASSLKFFIISLIIYSFFIIIIAYISIFITALIKKSFLRKISPTPFSMALTTGILLSLFLGTDVCYSKLSVHNSLSQLIGYGFLIFFASLFVFILGAYLIFTLIFKLSRQKLNIILILCFSIIFVIILTLCFTTQEQTLITNKDKNNIVFISIDTLRQDRLGCYGYKKPTSPNIDAIANEGIVFSNSFAQYHATLPSYMSMMTSLIPLVHDVIDSSAVLDKNRITLASLLKSNGYTCIAFVDGKRKSYIGGFHGFSRGFDWYGHYPENTTLFSKILPIRFILGFKVILNKYFPEHGNGITKSVISWIRKNKKYPFFLFIHYYSVHSQPSGLPYWRYPPFDKKLVDSPVIPEHFAVDGATGSRFLSKILHTPRGKKFIAEDLPVLSQLYDCGIAYVGAQIGKLYKELKNMNLLNTTAIIINSDHGEEFLEHDKLMHTQDYSECLKVPLIISAPLHRSHQRTICSNVQGIDLAPTILDIAGINAPAKMMGTSLMKKIRGEKMPEAVIISTCGHAMHYKNYALLIKEKDIELYDLNNDPKQKNDLSKSHETLFYDLMTIYNKTIEEHLAIKSKLTCQEEKEKIKLSPRDIERLKSLGYINDG